MLSIGFALLCGLLIYICYHISHDMINIVSVFTVPYMLIIPINNLIMVHRGFYQISNQVIYLIGGSLICIFIGYLIINSYLKVYKRKNAYQELALEGKFSFYKIEGMLKYVLFVEIIVLLRLVFIVTTNGLAYISNESFSGHMLSGPLGHLLLTIYPLVPILFLYWLKNKKQILYLLVTILCIGLLFTTFVKYHVIGFIVLIYLFVTLEDRRYLRKGLILVSAFAVGAFVLNYLVSFILSENVSKVAQEFYIQHLWNYMAGSLIHDNLVFTNGINVGSTTIRKIASAILTPINTITRALFGFSVLAPISDSSTNTLGFSPVGTNGEKGNVIDAFGWYYPSKGNVFEILFYVIFLVLIGIFFTLLYNNAIKREKTFFITISVVLVFFCFFSFFGQFYYTLPCWEVLIYSIVIPKLFDKRVKIVLHH